MLYSEHALGPYLQRFLGTTLEPLLLWLYTENELLDFYCFQEFPEHKIPDLSVYLDKSGYDFQFAPGFIRQGVTYGELTAFRSSKLKLRKTETISLGGKDEQNVVFTHNGRKLKQLDVILEMLSTTGPAIILGDFNYAVGRRKLVKTMED